MIARVYNATLDDMNYVCSRCNSEALRDDDGVLAIRVRTEAIEPTSSWQEFMKLVACLVSAENVSRDPIASRALKGQI